MSLPTATHIIRFRDPVAGTSHYAETPAGLSFNDTARFLAEGQIDARYDVEAVRVADEATGTFLDVTRDVVVAAAGRCHVRGECLPASLEAVADRLGVWLDRPERVAA